MKTIKIFGYLEYDDEIMHGDDDEAVDWFFQEILRGENIILVDNGDLGDVIGTFTVDEISG